MTYSIIHSDNLPYLKTLPDNSIDSIVTDPPYGLGKEPDALAMLKDWLDTGHYEVKGSGFMGKTWDAFVPQPALWKECLRVLKPGGHLVAFAGTRTQDLMTLGLRIAGFEIRDCLAWLYGSGFPKSLDISKALDKQAGAEREVELEIQAYLKVARESKGLSKSEVDRIVFGGTTRYAWVEGRGGQHQGEVYLPTPEEWVTLKEVLSLDSRYDAYIQKAVPSRAMRARADGGKGLLLSESEGDFGYQTEEGRWEGVQRVTAPATDLAKKWEGWGTALKPAHEPCILARKPLIGTVASNVKEYGTGAINVDGCRVGVGEKVAKTAGSLGAYGNSSFYGDKEREEGKYILGTGAQYHTSGRWPANVVLDEAAAEMLDEQTGTLSTTGNRKQASREAVVGGTTWGTDNHKSTEYPGDSGGPSRFFYTAKASRSERQTSSEVTNNHPTVKPVSLMRWLVKMVTPPGGTVLDPFNGSGSTGVAAVLEGFNYIGIEQDQNYVKISEARLKDAEEKFNPFEAAPPKKETPTVYFMDLSSFFE